MQNPRYQKTALYKPILPSHFVHRFHSYISMGGCHEQSYEKWAKYNLDNVLLYNLIKAMKHAQDKDYLI